MSIDHSFSFANDGVTEVKVNISGLNESSRDTKDLTAHLYAVCCNSGTPKFTCSLLVSQLRDLYSYLDRYEMLKGESSGNSGDFIQLKKGQEELVELLRGAELEQVVPALQSIVRDHLSKEDVNVILGRKDALDEFTSMLETSSQHTEPEWQFFFEKNDWIFGYGLRYKFLSILQRECRVSSVDLDGKNSVISDFLLSDTRFTKIVELKRPDTPLFKKGKNRSESWKLSSELTDAVSQILTQKASWEIKSQQGSQYDKNGERVTESTLDIDCILIIGMAREFSTDDKDSDIKRKTIELYRRNMRNIDIIFFDELLERAHFIVTGC